MIQKIKQFILVTMASASLFTAGLVPVLVSSASANTITDNLCTGTINATGGGTQTGANCGTAGTGTNDSLQKVASKIVTIFSTIVGIAAVIMIIYGGFRYITSGGDSGKVGNAKNALIYALVGLVIVALAQFLVHYVLNTASTVAPAGS